VGRPPGTRIATLSASNEDDAPVLGSRSVTSFIRVGEAYHGRSRWGEVRDLPGC
jgi:hypothetical protein